MNHYCKPVDDGMCKKHKQTAKITVDRISNLDEVNNLLDFVKCGICYNLLDNPKQCYSCDSNFCEKCIVKSLLMQNYCPRCY